MSPWTIHFPGWTRAHFWVLAGDPLLATSLAWWLQSQSHFTKTCGSVQGIMESLAFMWVRMDDRGQVIKNSISQMKTLNPRQELCLSQYHTTSWNQMSWCSGKWARPALLGAIVVSAATECHLFCTCCLPDRELGAAYPEGRKIQHLLSRPILNMDEGVSHSPQRMPLFVSWTMNSPRKWASEMGPHRPFNKNDCRYWTLPIYLGLY